VGETQDQPFQLSFKCVLSALLFRGVALGANPAATPTPDLWSMPAFQTLMNTLWQAPLTILAIVLALAGLIGWEGFRALGNRLRDQLIGEVKAAGSLATAAGLLDSAINSWQLAIDIAVAAGVTDPDREIPPSFFFNPPVLNSTSPISSADVLSLLLGHALPHLRSAKNESYTAITSYLRDLPDNAVLRGRSKRYIAWKRANLTPIT
jgi:hypothetical protein